MEQDGPSIVWLESLGERYSIVTTGRRIATDTAKLAMSNVLVRLLSLVSMPLLTLWLEPSAYGTAAMIMTLISLAAVIALAGVDISYIRGSQSRELPLDGAVESFVWKLALCSAVVAALVMLALGGIISDGFLLPSHVGLLLAGGILASIVQTMGQARARLHGRHGTMSIAIVSGGVVATLSSIGLAYWWRQDELPLVLSMIAGYVVSILILPPPPLTRLVRPSGLTKGQRRHVAGIGVAAMVTAPAFWVLSSSDRWFLGYFMDTHTVGIYSVAYSVAIVGMTVNTAVFAVWTPEAIRLFESGSSDRTDRLGAMTEGLIGALGVVWLAVVTAGGDLVRLLAAPAFHEGADIVPLIASAVFLHGTIHLSNTIFVIMKSVSRTMVWWVGGAVLCLVLNAILIPPLGMVGAALGQVFGAVFIAAGLAAGARHLLPLRLSWMRLGCLSLVVIVSAVFLVSPWSSSPLYSLLMKLPVGVGIAAVVAFGFAPFSAVVPRSSP